MKLLVLTSNPERASFRQRIGVYLDMLAAGGIETTVEVLSKSQLKRVAQFRRAARYDAVFLHKKCLNAVDAFVFRAPKERVIFNYDDAIMFSDSGQATSTHTSRFQRSLQKAGRVLVGSSYLAQQAFGHTGVTVLPLGLKTADYTPQMSKPADGRIRLVWIGSAPTIGYIQSMGPLIQTLAARHPGIVLRLIGDTFFDLQGVTVEKFPWHRDTRARLLAECDIGLAPLPDTPFTRGKCSFKVLEYSASGLPVVASPVGTNPDHVRDGRTGFLASDDHQWLQKLSTLVEDASLRVQMGKSGIEYAAAFDVSVIGRRFCEFLRRTPAR